MFEPHFLENGVEQWHIRTVLQHCIDQLVRQV